MNESDCADVQGRLVQLRRPRAVGLQALSNHPQKNTQHHVEHGPVALHEVAQSLWNRQHPLAHRQARVVELGLCTCEGVEGLLQQCAQDLGRPRAEVIALVSAEVPELLLVRRHDDAPAENGRFALPCRFVLAGESLPQAAVRELAEETGLHLAPSALVAVGEVEGGGRDPRDTTERWVRSHLFVARIDDAGRHTPLLAGTDTSRAFFVPVSRRPQYLAFDHDRLLGLGLVLGSG